MPRISAAPFRRARADRVDGAPWQLQEEDTWAELPKTLPHWDYNTDLLLSRKLNIDIEGVRADCGLEADEELRAVPVWWSSATQLYGTGTASPPLAGGTSCEVEVSMTCPGSELGGVVSIRTQLVLSVTSRPRPLTAHLSGSVLWQDLQRVAVEGSASRFPLEIIDFASVTWAPDGAAWFLAWDRSDLHQRLLGSVRLYINARHERAAAAAKGPGLTPENNAIASAIRYDVGRTLIIGALQNDEFVHAAESFSEGSTGRAAARLLAFVFPSDRPADLRNMLRERPADFEAILQEQLQLFRS